MPRRWLITAVLGLTLGLHWGALQVVAWTGMLIDYTATYGLVGGVTKTFDGSAPCHLCTAIQAATAPESEPIAPPPPRVDASQWYLPGASIVMVIPEVAMRSCSVAATGTIPTGCCPTPEPPPPRQAPAAHC